MRRKILLAASLACAFAPLHAGAFWNDRLEVFAGQSYTWDSNVFRLSRDFDLNAATGSAARNDRFWTTSVGANLDVPYSLQRFQGSFTWFTTRYQRFDQLDFTGHNARAAWLWAVTPQLTGDVGASSSRTLANFAIFQGTERDLLTSREGHANATWAWSPALELYGGVSRNERRHDAQDRRVNDLDANSVEGRVTLVSAAENRLGVAVRREEGRSPEQVLAGGTRFDNRYRQDSVGLVGRYAVSGNSRLDARVDYVRRDYDQFDERDYSGPSYRVTHTWTPTGKLTFTTAAYREIAPLDEIQTSFVLVKGVSFRPKWDATAKIAVLGNFEWARWDYRASIPALASATFPGVFARDYRHNVRTAGVSVVWRPYTRVSLQAGFSRETRSSTLDLADYAVNLFTIEGRVGF